MTPERSRLRDREIHLWWACPADLGPAAVARFHEWMTPDERARGARFALAHLRHDFAVTRGLVRWTLSRYAPVAPADWRFGTNAWGRPHVTAPAAAVGVHFNVSHTRGFVVCGVAATCGIGVDVEEVTRAGETVELAERFFSPSEVRELRELPADRQRERFFRLWTLKEAYVKARGMGLRLPLDQFSFRLASPDERIRISFGAGIRDEPDRWQFALLQPTPTHRLAVAVNLGASEPCSLVLERVSQIGEAIRPPGTGPSDRRKAREAPR